MNDARADGMQGQDTAQPSGWGDALSRALPMSLGVAFAAPALAVKR